MTQSDTGDVNALIPKPTMLRVGGEELRLQALPIKRLLIVVRYIESNVDVLDSLQKIGKKKEEGGASVSELLEGEVYKRINGFIRLLFSKEDAAKLTDEWCSEHLSNAHYVAIIETVIKQNRLDGLFQKAKEMIGGNVAAALRQTMDTAAAPGQ